jgi:hypothetical protein
MLTSYSTTAEKVGSPPAMRRAKEIAVGETTIALQNEAAVIV